ncbi:MFS transporter [Nocardiopsis sp. L17-MgMaSL7]|uniref:MFS transporter n=1 Tax=Nocardiopsis sp. L17-MgMaSL7 TaxID=1938893 RepID=UPI000D71563C|nr:MFS transporter [Nocardiopsis sp. L17-MgMaSL7]PWV44341.1 DHA2 family multidrug resistance protein-like MFS transporter [Nocardiopsis sp. L17-MgMaSL7]
MRTPPRATGRTWLGLALLLIPALLVSMDLSVLFVAAPAISRDLDPTGTQWLWMMDVYGFVLAGLLLTMGALGDRIGRKRLLLGGAVAFGAASVLLALAPTPELFIVGRALLGVGGATLAPSTFSLIRAMFTDPGQRRAAIGLWTVAFTGGAVIGPIIGGVLLEFLPWGSVFLINLPFMLVLLLVAPLLLPESRNPSGAAFDLVGAATSLVAILGLVHAAKRLVGHGPDAPALTAFAIGTAALVAFVVCQRGARNPLVDLSLFIRPALTASVTSNAVVSFAAAGLGLLTFTFLQVVHGLSPLVAALYALPTILGTALGATLAGVLADRVRPAVLMALGLATGATGFTVVGLSDGVLPFLAGYVVVTLGIGAVATLANTLILATAPPERAGAAAGLSETSTELGAALGIATLGTIATSVYRSGMRELPEAGEAARETVAGAATTAAHLPAAEARTLLDTAFVAYSTGVTAAALSGAAVLAAVTLLALVALRNLPAGSEAPERGEPVRP